jgi:hypothetical protein
MTGVSGHEYGPGKAMDCDGAENFPMQGSMSCSG